MNALGLCQSVMDPAHERGHALDLILCTKALREDPISGLVIQPEACSHHLRQMGKSLKHPIGKVAQLNFSSHGVQESYWTPEGFGDFRIPNKCSAEAAMGACNMKLLEAISMFVPQ